MRVLALYISPRSIDIGITESAGYSVVERNVIPSCSYLISALCIFLWGFGSDLTGSRFAFVFGPLVSYQLFSDPLVPLRVEQYVIQFYGLLPTGILAFWPKNKDLILFAFMTGVSHDIA